MCQAQFLYFTGFFAVGGAAYLWYLSHELALACGGVTFVLWGVALKYGGFSRKAQRTYQDALANTNEVPLSENFAAHYRMSLLLLDIALVRGPPAVSGIWQTLSLS